MPLVPRPAEPAAPVASQVTPTPHPSPTPFALVFPGQGSQFPEMIDTPPMRTEAADQCLADLEQLLDVPVRRLCAERRTEELARTEVTQPAVFAVSLASLAALRAELPDAVQPRACAGHSLGHFAALVAAGALDVASAAHLVVERARIMAACAGGAMAAVLGLPKERLDELVATADGVVVVANVNTPDQTVISGEADAVDAVGERAVAAGARRVVRLAIGVAAHSPLMADAAAEFAAVVAAAPIDDPLVPVVANCDGTMLRSAAAIRRNLLDHMLLPVDWQATVLRLRQEGVAATIEIGPGAALSKFSAVVAPEIAARSISLVGPEAAGRLVATT